MMSAPHRQQLVWRHRGKHLPASLALVLRPTIWTTTRLRPAFAELKAPSPAAGISAEPLRPWMEAPAEGSGRHAHARSILENGRSGITVFGRR